MKLGWFKVEFCLNIVYDKKLSRHVVIPNCDMWKTIEIIDKTVRQDIWLNHAMTHGDNQGAGTAIYFA